MTLGILKRFRKYIFKKKLVRANQFCMLWAKRFSENKTKPLTRKEKLKADESSSKAH